MQHRTLQFRKIFGRTLLPLLLGIACIPSTAVSPSDGSLADPNLRYVGRWDKAQADVYTGNWSGVFVRARFTGTSVGVRLREGTALRVSLDGEAPRIVNAGVGVTTLNTAPLKAGDHTVQVGSAGQNYDVSFQGLVLEPGATTKPVAPCPIIEYVGDSITVGTDSYSFLSAEMLNADPVLIAFSARALTSGYGCVDDKTGLDTQYFRLKNFNHTGETPPVPWNFDYAPQTVVINLGQNDQCGQEPETTLTRSMTDFLHHVRARLPQAQLVVLRPFGGPYEKAIRRACDALTTAGDKRVRYVDTTGWLASDDYVDGVHPNWNGNLKAASRLATELRPLLTP